MRVVKVNGAISQFQSNFESVFCFLFESDIFCLTMKRSFKACNLHVVKKLYLEKSDEKMQNRKSQKIL